jgi:GT2 family glycosyltransferase/glycosyltransferase involved in cell wall biosynthesis
MGTPPSGRRARRRADTNGEEGEDIGMTDFRTGVVSVVLVNFRGADDTITAVRHLRQGEWPADRLEIVVVDNASGDDSVEKLRAALPDVTLVESSDNTGFAGGCNLGVRHSSGEFVAFLNNDAKPHPRWIPEAIAHFATSSRVGAVASTVLDWDGERVDFTGAAMTWFGMGYKPLTGQLLPKKPETPQTNVLFGTGSAMFVRRDVYDVLGGFDERYFMFFEDVDFGWRLNLRGYTFAYAPSSIAYHKHHASMASYGAYKESYLLERNALYTLYKNLGEEALHESLAGALALAVRRAVARTGRDSTEFDLRKPGSDTERDLSISRDGIATMYGIDQFVENLPSLAASRAEIQGSRVLSDASIWRLFGETDAPSFTDEHFLRGYSNIVETLHVLEPPVSTRVLIITGDPVGPKMAGPAIRAWHMATALSEENDVTLVTLSGITPVSSPFRVVHVAPGDEKAMRVLEAEADVIIFQGLAMAMFSTIRDTQKILVVDVYDPMHLEQLEQARGLGAAEWNMQVTSATDVLNQQLSRGDFFLCASEQQRHLYIGQLAALGRINTANYDRDPDLTGLIDVVPFGLESVPPRHERDVLKGVLPGIGADDKLLLWSGGLYNWFDPQTLIRAVSALSERRDGVRLFFQGTKHPHPGVPEMAIVSECRTLAADLGALDRSVFFNASWVDYADRQNYLLEADAGVSTHHAHIETTFSFRTRILDYLWAELPMVVTEGDHFAELVAQNGLGIVVPSGDVDALTDALEKVLFDEAFASECAANIRRVRELYKWDKVLEPLVDFVREPRHARDLVISGRVGDAVSARAGRPGRSPIKYGIRRDVGLAVHYLKSAGPVELARRVRGRLNRR